MLHLDWNGDFHTFVQGTELEWVERRGIVYIAAAVFWHVIGSRYDDIEYRIAERKRAVS